MCCSGGDNNFIRNILQDFTSVVKNVIFDTALQESAPKSIELVSSALTTAGMSHQDAKVRVSVSRNYMGTGQDPGEGRSYIWWGIWSFTDRSQVT